MFFSSVLVPSPSEPAGRTLTLASARSEPSSMLQSLTSEAAQRLAELAQEGAGVGGRAQVGLGHDLQQRRPAAVEVDPRALGARAAPARADVDELGGVLLEVRAGDAHLELPAVRQQHGDAAGDAQRLVVLGDLVRLREVGIEVVLAVELRVPRAPRSRGRGPPGSPAAPPPRLVTGRAPGWARQIGQVWVFGGSPKLSSQPQNILVRVASWTWISSPITGSQRAMSPAARREAARAKSLSARSQDPRRPRVEADGALEGVGHVEQAVLAEGRADELQPDGEPVRQAAGDRQRRQAGEARAGSCRRRTGTWRAGPGRARRGGRRRSARSARRSRQRARRRRRSPGGSASAPSAPAGSRRRSSRTPARRCRA